VELTDTGLEHVEQALGCGSLHDGHNIPLLTEVNCALHAHVLLRRDTDYIVRGGRVEVVDELTGRVVPDRQWPDGLQAAIEAKEGLEPGVDGRILGSLTLQRLLRGYSRLCGMTGTARDAAEELKHTYGLDVVVIPTHRPVVRVDRDDVVFTHRDAKESAVVAEVRRAHAAGRPVLVGTTTVTESERLAGRIRGSGIPCAVLNAKNDAEEAAIVASAGRLGAVTISTNMAGRGTDIRLGGELGADHERVATLGGLYVIGTNRHESRRIDLQLRGRAGRQGDPGESQFFVSLEDDLLVRYRTRGLIPARFIPARSDAPIGIPVVNREIARTQRIVEGQNFEIRGTLARYSHVVEQQHEWLMERRRAMLAGSEPVIWRKAPAERNALVAAVGEEEVLDAERRVTLGWIDRAWRDHLAFCAELREGIHLVRLGGSDPLTRFSSEAIRRFDALEDAIDDAVLATLPTVRVVDSRIDLSAAGLAAPSSTWTYLVNDDPFRDRMATLLMGAGGVTIAMYSAAVLMPLLIAWGIVERLRRRWSRH
jgi:preprotein translocase subunit SecA